MAELWRLAEHCQFGDGLSDMLRDRLVCGLHSESMQKRLLTERDLTFDASTGNSHLHGNSCERRAGITKKGISGMSHEQVHKYPTNAEYIQVAKALIVKYPFLER
ncbi:hypothetical protein QTP70_007083 [Hemibagrus guttatus]|uniref:Uncharacterized protein n=1 Tax=Hemibagrus guttatus TaxID=175788 RepID=A0AAE0RHQ1_9TELE|nr:hypothetical protein QTP70_007083 [Hemibagrus guttatus]KAK3574308.1 hypothetical protein QTP86_004344 [Hemibagrus guttatus]